VDGRVRGHHEAVHLVADRVPLDVGADPFVAGEISRDRAQTTAAAIIVTLPTVGAGLVQQLRSRAGESIVLIGRCRPSA
jgi:hypothetical protein